jgi:hypothetical protein
VSGDRVKKPLVKVIRTGLGMIDIISSMVH